MIQIVLASGSSHRAEILKNAGISFEQQSSELDERALEAPLEEANILPSDRAIILAEAKAQDVSKNHPGKYIIGCDQILALGEEVLHKPKDMEDARRRLLHLSGKTHHLHSAVVIVRDGQTLWRHVTHCDMNMRNLTPEFIGQHLAKTGDSILSSVGAYQIEGLGSQLFTSIGGDFFSIVGLPLLPLLEAMRELDMIDG